MQFGLFEKVPSKAQRVEDALRKAGLKGISNAALNHISFRYGAIIHNLRKDGHEIITGPTSKTGLVIYTWIR